MAKASHIQTTIGKVGAILRSIPANVSVMIWGGPGEGKTGTVNSVFENDHTVWPILAGCSDPTDMGGIPDKMADAPAFEHFPPLWAFVGSTVYPDWYKANKDSAKGLPVPGKLVLFFDDVVTADEQTQASLFKAIHERRVGRLFLRDDVRIILAGNRPEDKSAAQDMPLALANRMLHFHIRSDMEEWARWAVEAGVHPLIIAYLRSQPQDLSTFNEAVKHNQKAFATPRSWHLLSDVLKTVDTNDEDTRFLLASGMIGEGTATKLCAFFRSTVGLIPPEEIVNDPDKCRLPDSKNLDLAHATVAALEGYVVQNNALENIKAAMTYGLRLQVEFGVVLAQSVIQIVVHNLSADKKAKMMTDTTFSKALQHWNKYFN
jgi:MoxR-like ATPase